jgi:hypothetical protein
MNPNLKPWPKNVSGNPGGRRRKPMLDKMLEEGLIAEDSAKAKQIADRLISLAAHGSIAAAKLIVERTEGRPLCNVADGGAKEPQLSKEQIQARLAQLLSAPDVKEQIMALLGNEDKVQ